MNHANYHCHTTYCDGKNTIDDLLLEADRLGLHSLGITSHAPAPVNAKWLMRSTDLPKYLHQFSQKQDLPFQLYKGLEVDYIGHQFKEHYKKVTEKLDFFVGSVHFLGNSNRYYEIDGPKKDFLDCLNIVFGGDIKAMVKEYVDLQIEMIEEIQPDIIGHIDKLKIHNLHSPLFDEQEEWYQAEMKRLIKAIAQSNTILEINTRGKYKLKYDHYPSNWMVEYALELNTKLMVNSDAHLKQELTAGFDEAHQKLHEMGCREVWRMENGAWNVVPLPINQEQSLLSHQ